MSSLGWALIQYNCCPYFKKTQKDMYSGRTPIEVEGRDQGDASTSQEMPRIASKAPEGRRVLEQFFWSSPQQELTLTPLPRTSSPLEL